MKYEVKPRAQIVYAESVGMDISLEGYTVYEEDKYTPTGVLNSSGDELYRVAATVPMGFHYKKDC